MYTLYGYRRSGSAVVEFTLAELGVEYDFHEVSLCDNSQRGKAYREVNPQGKVPALLCPDGSIITESAAIVLWLLETHGDHELLPPVGSVERASALRWLMFIASDLYQLIEINDYPERFISGGNEKTLQKRAREIWRERWLIIENTVAGPWLLGERFTVTDLYIAVISRWGQQDDWRPTHIPKIESIFRQVSQREACREVFENNYGI